MGLFDRFRTSRSTVQEKNEHFAQTAARENALRLIDKGNLIEEAGNLDEALRCYDEAIAKAPGLARAHMNRGNILLACGNTEGALQAYRKALELEPDYAAAHYNIGNAHANLDNHEAACAAYENAIRIQPQFVDAHVALGCSLEDTERSEEAIACYRKALEIDPDYAEVHNNLGRVLLAKGHQDEALLSFDRALELGPDNAEALLNLAIIQKSRGQLQAALSNLRRAQKLSPESVEILVNMGDTHLELEQLDDASACYRKALEIEPDNAVIHNNLGNVHFRLDQFAEAVTCYRRATELRPDFSAAHGNLGAVLKDIGEPLEGLKSVRRSLEIAPEASSVRSNLLFIAHSLEDQLNDDMLFAEAKTFGEIAAQQAKPAFHWNNQPDPDRRLKVGLVSGDLCLHPVGFFIEGVLHSLAKRASGNLEIFAYSNFPRVDSVTERIKARCQHWKEIFGRTDEEVAKLIQQDQIDILIDLAGHTARNRLPIFAWKPAPIQVTWLGYFATTGVNEIDYLIADPWTLPESEENFFTEKIWRLPETRLCFTPPDINVTIRPLPTLTEPHLTFGCFNNLNKMNDSVVGVWARILAATPNSRLFLKARQLYHPVNREAVVSKFFSHGIDPARLVLEGPVQRANYLAAYNRVDIALDPFPYTGGTTTAEALWMGVPVLTLAGKQFLARQGVGLLGNAGLSDWIATDLDDYVARAVSHASDVEGLAALRLRLREQVLNSPIFDASRFAMHFEEALRGMWKKWCSEHPH